MSKIRLLFFPAIFLAATGCDSASDKTLSPEEYEMRLLELDQRERQLAIRERELDSLQNYYKYYTYYSYPDGSVSGYGRLLLADVYDEVKSGVFLVHTTSEYGNSLGSAFVVSRDGFAISNYHVFENASESFLRGNDGKKYLITEVIDADQDKDYILFRIGPILSDLTRLKIANEKPRIGEDCFAIGNPRGLEQTLSRGIISQIRDYKLQTTAEITYGSSGGPLFNYRGEVIGITTRGLGEANLNFAIDISEVSGLDSTRYSAKASIDEGILSEEELKKKILGYYGALRSKNYKELAEFYAPLVARFFDKFNLNREEAIDKARSYDTKFDVIDRESKIRWETLEMTKQPNGKTTASFIVDYSLLREGQNRPVEYVLDMVFLFNQDLQIESIYENILSKVDSENEEVW